MNYTTTLLVFFALLVGALIMSRQQSTRIEVETGRNTLDMRQAIERERLAADEQMQRRRIEAEAARQYEYFQGQMKQQQQRIDAGAARQRAYIEAQQERDAERLRQKCVLENRRYCMY
jgi:hypothetical protein